MPHTPAVAMPFGIIKGVVSCCGWLVHKIEACQVAFNLGTQNQSYAPGINKERWFVSSKSQEALKCERESY